MLCTSDTDTSYLILLLLLILSVVVILTSPTKRERERERDALSILRLIRLVWWARGQIRNNAGVVYRTPCLLHLRQNAPGLFLALLVVIGVVGASCCVKEKPSPLLQATTMRGQLPVHI